jgi:hypothetical protein
MKRNSKAIREKKNRRYEEDSFDRKKRKHLKRNNQKYLKKYDYDESHSIKDF